MGVYTFALMVDAAVCKFELVRGNGTKVQGVVKEKQEAKQEYDNAVSKGFTAGLGQQEAGDVFSISVGNIFPAETVTINLQYVQTLMDDEKHDQVKFIFPRTYAQRYGSAPSVNSALGRTSHQPFRMELEFQQAGDIKSISCPSGHPISFDLGRPDANGIAPQDGDFASVSLIDTTGFLTQDVVVVVTATGLDAPRCFIQNSPNHESTALALTFVPRFNLPDVQGGMEYIFLVDRSGSMQGEKIRLVREALVVLLRGLPTTGTTFNIFSFGSKATKFWDSSRSYTQSNLDKATKHIDSMDADYGGTEIASALRLAYDSLSNPLKRPVAVFLITDGEAWDVSTCIEHTQNARSTLSDDPKSFMRVFTMGIGSGASSDTCEGIARAGDGMTVYVKEGEPILGKCARLVRAARTPRVKVEVEWGVVGDGDGDGDGNGDEDFEMVEPSVPASSSAVSAKPAGPINLFNANSTKAQLSTGPPPKPNPTLPPVPRIQQSPLGGKISNIFPGTRTQVYALVRTSNGEALDDTIKEVKLKGVVTSTGDDLELVVPVMKTLSSSPFIPTLAAKALIRDREEGKSQCTTDKSDLKEAYLEKDIIRLGTQYTLASKYTSFVAVDSTTQVPALAPSSPRAAGFASGSVRAMSAYCAPSMRSSAPYVRRRSIGSPTGSVKKASLKGKAKAPTAYAARDSPTPSPPLTISPVTALARLQQCHGGFPLCTQLLAHLGDPGSPTMIIAGDIKALAWRFSKDCGIANPDVGATLLAVIWMEYYGKGVEGGEEEMRDMKEKAEAWVRGELGVGDDGEALRKYRDGVAGVVRLRKK
ncbi:hypothetical protein BDP27DRAFT_1444996 [Rhodocollybia butyracea]|uniref:Uncharacterized protein n=1 Tax=Rhodocollybia butyracea TaxID=206335 RepID=A0A9P5Q0N4_9AGAR|nr:hypothetical protein BDP27DRAFT_1444996 [Rhodocollybia butyracea]